MALIDILECGRAVLAVARVSSPTGQRERAGIEKEDKTCLQFTGVVVVVGKERALGGASSEGIDSTGCRGEVDPSKWSLAKPEKFPFSCPSKRATLRALANGSRGPPTPERVC